MLVGLFRATFDGFDQIPLGEATWHKMLGVWHDLSVLRSVCWLFGSAFEEIPTWCSPPIPPAPPHRPSTPGPPDPDHTSPPPNRSWFRFFILRLRSTTHENAARSVFTNLVLLGTRTDLSSDHIAWMDALNCALTRHCWITICFMPISAKLSIQR